MILVRLPIDWSFGWLPGAFTTAWFIRVHESWDHSPIVTRGHDLRFIGNKPWPELSWLQSGNMLYTSHIILPVWCSITSWYICLAVKQFLVPGWHPFLWIVLVKPGMPQPLFLRFPGCWQASAFSRTKSPEQRSFDPHSVHERTLGASQSVGQEVSIFLLNKSYCVSIQPLVLKLNSTMSCIHQHHRSLQQLGFTHGPPLRM